MHPTSTHKHTVLGKPLRPSLLSRSRSHVCAHTRYRCAYPCPYQSLTHIGINAEKKMHKHDKTQDTISKASCSSCVCDHTKPHMLPHTPSPPPMAPYTLPPSLHHSLERRELVKDARRQHADRVVAQAEVPGHETRRQSALTLSTSTCPLCPSACTCMCPMHMRHAHARVLRGSLSLDMCAPCMRVRMCMCR
jgi:hypothetical protein